MHALVHYPSNASIRALCCIVDLCLLLKIAQNTLG
jgi:hypothetical protein